jgi:ABC-type multidrug transport system fused ATPase/permease subunit
LSAVEKLHTYFSTIARYKEERMEFLVALMRVWFSDDNAIVREKAAPRAGRTDHAAHRAIIRQGIAEGSFSLADPEQMARVVLALILDTGDDAGQLYLARLRGEVAFDVVRQRFAAYETALERLLGGGTRRAGAHRRADAAHLVRSTDPKHNEGELMTAVIHTEKLSKYYGQHRGIVDVDLDVNEGEAFGFSGPNGAGKTTMIRTLLDHIRPTSGTATIFGIGTTDDPVAIHKRLGYLPGEFALYDKLTGGQTLDYFANLRGGIDRAYQGKLIERLEWTQPASFASTPRATSRRSA